MAKMVVYEIKEFRGALTTFDVYGDSKCLPGGNTPNLVVRILTGTEAPINRATNQDSVVRDGHSSCE
jgi:hypothetical protein